ncbi:uncharacterized protein LOC133783998 [Humulus lupulus]|uniref:uncharacterized protein LOC133783998 n=1 Tax=Humulus lupulus TaxID=3486 RepID=UPI002B41868A|nr:uncharacterized protein LOC133783998 [Humulus lupulus]
MQFIYVLLGWEGSVADSRVLRDAISRTNGLKVPQERCLTNGATGGIHKLVEVLTDTVKKFGDIQAVAGDSIPRIADCFQFETEGATRRMKVFDELKQIDGLTNEQRVKARKLFVQNQAYIDFLFTLDDEFKLGFILGLFE